MKNEVFMTSLAIKREIIANSVDPKAALLYAIGQDAIDNYDLFEDDLLVATYVPPAKIGSIIIPGKSQEENRFQGKCGLILKMGPTAFKYNRSQEYAFEGKKPEVGQWAVLRFSDAWEVGLKGVSCRIVRANQIRGIVADPSVMW